MVFFLSRSCYNEANLFLWGHGDMANGNRGGYDREHRGLIRRIRAVLGLIVLAVVVFGLMLGFALVRDDGMRPAYKSGSVVAYLRVSRDCKRGDPVCLKLPDGNAAVRRVVAVQGDSVDIRSGIAYINGIAERGSYSFTRTDRREDGPIYPVILRAGEYFVLGDSRETAVDSRSFGPVRADELLGRPLF